LQSAKNETQKWARAMLPQATRRLRAAPRAFCALEIIAEAAEVEDMVNRDEYLPL